MIKLNNYIFVSLFFLFSCSSGFLNYKKTKDEFKNTEFDQKVKIIETEEALPAPVAIKEATLPQEQVVNKGKTLGLTDSKSNKTLKKIVTAKTMAVATPVSTRRQPEIEDSEGFDNLRRPKVDPFKVGEKVIHEVSYLGATAGKFIMQVKPFATVNGKKNYNFFIDVKSSSFFSSIFAVDDQFQTYVDYETLVPGAYKIDIRDSMQIKEVRAYFDANSLTANYWEHKYTEKSGHEERKVNWSILPYSQNLISPIFYMRIFNWVVGREYAFRVADDQKNVVFKAKATEKIKIKTDAGEFNAIKIKAEVVSRGNLSKASDFFMWLSDDEHKYILKIEFKLPVGSLVSEVVEIKHGQ